jgi:hypothetical protein
MASILLYFQAARLFSLPCALMRMRHEEAANNYAKAEANVNGDVDVLRCFCQRVRTETRPQAAAEARPTGSD